VKNGKAGKAATTIAAITTVNNKAQEQLQLFNNLYGRSASNFCLNNVY